MAAPSTGRSVTIAVGAVLKLQVKPPPTRPPRLSVAVTVGKAILTLARVIIGVVYFKDCPQQPNIPNYLLGLALMTLLLIPFVTLPCESDAARELPRGFKACLLCSLSVFLFLWILAGDVWVFSVYQPNYDPAAADGLYCNETLYTFAFWTAAWETFVICFLLTGLCRRLMCYVLMSPVPTSRDFDGTV